MEVEVIQRGNKYYLRRTSGYTGFRRSASWYEYYTESHQWVRSLGFAKLFDSIKEAADFPERVVAILSIKDSAELKTF